MNSESQIIITQKLKPIFPAFGKNNVPVVFSSDDQFSRYTGVTIQSLLENSSPEYCYDIFILDGGITSPNRERVLSLIKGRQNVSVRFVDIRTYFSSIGGDIFYIPEAAHFSQANYYRFFLPKIFSEFPKIVYLDSDLILLTDVADLCKFDIGDKLLGAVKDAPMNILRNTYKNHEVYLYKTLGMSDPESYFNTGVLVCNITKMIEVEFTQKCLERLRKIKCPIFVDQCIINSLTVNDVHFLDPSWNFTVNVLAFEKKLLFQTPGITVETIMNAYARPKIVHYASSAKPWKFDACGNECAQYWWHYASMTPFLDYFLAQLNENSTAAQRRADTIAADVQKQKRKKTKVSLLGIPLLKILHNNGNQRVLLFNFIPIFTLTHK